MVFSLILACTLEGGIGYYNSIPWNIKEEMRLFKKITSDVNCYFKKNAVIMGRNTWESLPYRPLKNRINIIITANPSLVTINDVDVITCKTMDDALDYCEESLIINKVFIIGGKSIYDLCLNNDKYLNLLDSIHLSVIKDNHKCDTFINLKKILKTFKNYNINDIIFNSKFIHIKFLCHSI